MPIDIKPKFIDSEMTTDVELANEANQRASEDLTFLKHDGSRPMSGNLDLNQHNISNTNKAQNKIFITTPTFTTATTNGSLNLTNASASVHFISGTASGFSIAFPDATTLDIGTNFEIYNRSSSPIFLKHFDGSLIGVLSTESVSSLILQDNSTSKGNFSPFQVEVNQASGVANYTATGNTNFSTTAINTYQQVTDFAVIPAAGKYSITFNCSCLSTTNNAINYVALYKDTTMIATTERIQQSVASNFQFGLSTLGIVDFNGMEELRLYIKVSAGVLTISARTGVALRLGPVG